MSDCGFGQSRFETRKLSCARDRRLDSRERLPDFSQKTLSIFASHPARFLQWRNAHMSNGSARKSIFGTALKLLKLTAEEWLDDKAPQLGAALAFYTVLSLAPLVLILLAIIGVIFRHDPAGAWTKLTEQMSYFLVKSA